MRLRHVILLTALAAVPAWAQNPGDAIFSGTKIHTLTLRFAQPRYWDSLTRYYTAGMEQCIAATAIINGEVIDSVGVRFKGNSSYSHPNNKKPFTISFDEYRKDQRWDGVKSIHLNNGFGDPTMLREKIHLDFCRDAGIAAPRANFVQLSLNDTAWGFYTVVEHVDKTWLRGRFGTDDGYLFKAVDAFGGAPGGTPVLSDLRYYGAGIGNYLTRYEQKTGDSLEAWTALVTFIDLLNNGSDPAAGIPAMLDAPGFYRALAADIMLGNLDSYVGSGRNYYAFIDSASGLLRWIVWDVNMSMGTYPQGSTTIETLPINYVSSATGRPLVGRILNTPTLRGQYLETMCRLTGRFFSAARLHPVIDTLAALIRPYVAADRRKQYPIELFDQNIASDVTAGGSGPNRQRKPGLKSFVTTRAASIASQLASMGISCAAANPAAGVVINEIMTDNDIIPDPSGDHDDWIELHNTGDQLVELGGMFLSDNFDAPSKWTFPEGTTIGPGAYLIVWADEDFDQPGLHAGFKLTADGERVILSAPDLTVIDSVTFGAQTTNLSLARIPNGTGPFRQGEPTFVRSNDVSTAAPIEATDLLLSLGQNHPNPVDRSTTIELRLASPSHVTLTISDALGNVVATLLDERRAAGSHGVLWTPRGLAAGSYFYTVRAGGRSITRMLVLR